MESRNRSQTTAAAELAREIIAERIGEYEREYFVAVFLSAKNRPVGY